MLEEKKTVELKEEELEKVNGSESVVDGKHFKYDIGDRFMYVSSGNTYYVKVISLITKYYLPEYETEITLPNGTIISNSQGEKVLDGYTKIN